MGYLEIWIKERCSRCSKSEKCRPYSLEMIICIMNHIVVRKNATIR